MTVKFIPQYISFYINGWNQTISADIIKVQRGLKKREKMQINEKSQCKEIIKTSYHGYKIKSRCREIMITYPHIMDVNVGT